MEWFQLLIIIVIGIIITVVIINRMLNSVQKRSFLLIPTITSDSVMTEMNEDKISRAVFFDHADFITKPVEPIITSILPEDDELVESYRQIAKKSLKKDYSICSRCRWERWRCMCHRMKKKKGKNHE